MGKAITRLQKVSSSSQKRHTSTERSSRSYVGSLLGDSTARSTSGSGNQGNGSGSDSGRRAGGFSNAGRAVPVVVVGLACSSSGLVVVVIIIVIMVVGCCGRGGGGSRGRLSDTGWAVL
jgi:hypothetical protein